MSSGDKKIVKCQICTSRWTKGERYCGSTGGTPGTTGFNSHPIVVTLILSLISGVPDILTDGEVCIESESPPVLTRGSGVNGDRRLSSWTWVCTVA